MTPVPARPGLEMADVAELEVEALDCVLLDLPAALDRCPIGPSHCQCACREADQNALHPSYDTILVAMPGLPDVQAVAESTGIRKRNAHAEHVHWAAVGPC